MGPRRVLAVGAFIAIGLYLGPVWGTGVGLAALAIATAIFGCAATVITVAEQRVTIGRSVIEPRFLRSAQPLTAEQTVRRAGPDADARAHLVLRPYVAASVELDAGRPGRPGALLAGLHAPAR